jgi:zinc-binding alcohol dehydrogenase/oxidoreductase
MKAIVFDPQTVSPVLGEWQIEQPGPDEVVVRLKAAALNHRDIHITHPAGKTPFVYGSDGAGVIEAVGEHVQEWHKDDEVIINAQISCGQCQYCLTGDHALCEKGQILGGKSLPGTLAEFVKVPARNLTRKPQHLTFHEAAALPLAGGTAWRSLITKAQLQSGETVLIQGIGGGVALHCLQIAVGIGARVIVTSGSNDKLRKAVDLGAVAGINYKEEDVIEAVKQFTGNKGADVVISSNGTSLSLAIAAAAKGGRVIQFAYTGQSIPAFDVDMLMFKQLSLIGTGMNSDSEFVDAIRFFNEHKIVPIVSEIIPLEQVQQGFERMKNSSQFGKIVLSIEE